MTLDPGRLLVQGLEASREWEGAQRGSDAEQLAAEQATACWVLLNEALSRGSQLLPASAVPGQLLK
jgi:hypothetical protein